MAGKDGEALIFCHAGCEAERVMAALGGTLADLYPPRDEAVAQNGAGRRIAATYDYRDEAGDLLYQVVRYAPKDFRQRRPDGGGWVWNLKGVRHVLYRLPELLAAPVDAGVLIPEGEKDVERLVSLGFVATTNAQGAGKWHPEYTRTLEGRRVVLIPDNDEPGDRHAETVAASLHGVAAEVRVVRLPGLLPKGDVSDWLDAGHSVDDLQRLIADTPAWEPNAASAQGDGQPRSSRLVIRSLADIQSQPVEWFWYRWLPRGKFHLVGGHAGDGKSTLLAAFAAAGSLAQAWPDETCPPRRFRTLFLLGEDSAGDTLRPRLELHDADMNQVFVIETVLDELGHERFFNVGRHLDLLEAAIREHAIDWVIIDPLTTIMPGTDRNAEGDTRDTLTPLIKLADRCNVTITGVAHVGKPNGSSRRAMQRILGATAFHALARVVWMIAPDEDERMVLGVVKSNLAMRPPSLMWTREEDGPVRWEGVAAQDVEDLLSGAPLSSAREDAEGFLREYLAGGSKATVAVEQAAKARGITKITLRRAADVLSIRKRKDSGTHGNWYWSLPDGQPRTAETASEAAQSNLLNSRDLQVSKLSIFPGAKVLNGATGEHLHATTPLLGSDPPAPRIDVMEDAQLAHPSLLRGEQVTWDATHDAPTVLDGEEFTV